MGRSSRWLGSPPDKFFRKRGGSQVRVLPGPPIFGENFKAKTLNNIFLSVKSKIYGGESKIGYVGRHLIVEFFNCDFDVINDEKFLESVLVKGLNEAGGRIIWKFFYKFHPYGVTGVILIAESHLSIHTWPEKGYVAIDIFTCGSKMDPWKAYKRIVEEIKPKRVRVLELKRGAFHKPKIVEEVLS